MNELPIFITNFFINYLANERNFSTNTIKSYRDTFSLFFLYLKNKLNIQAHKATLDIFTKQTILNFLDWLELDRKCSVRSRNQRLSAIHSFCKYIQYKNPDLLSNFTDIISINFKKFHSKTVDYLSIDQIKCLLSLPDTSKLSGRRDLTILTVLYDTAARVQELCDLKLNNIRLEQPYTISLSGKGNKTRVVPLLDNTAKLLSVYLKEHFNHNNINDNYLFKNRYGNKLTRFGISYILDKYVDILRTKFNNLPSSISPHILRHSKAMHMYQSGVSLIYIRDLLGHVDISVTDIYARADISSIRNELEKVYESESSVNLPEWTDNNQLLDFLKNL
jgi:site-specific recombinase XerD